MSNNSVHDYIAGALGGMAGLVVGHPFDTTKVQMQTQQTSSAYKGTYDAIRNISKSGLNRGFFRGMAFPLLSYGAINSVFFGVYGNALKYFQRGDDGHYLPATYTQVYVAGCMGGAAQLIVACPADVVKVILQSQIPHPTTPGAGQTTISPGQTYFKGPVDCIRSLIRKKGVSSLYRGLCAMSVRDIPAYGLYLWVYEASYRRIMKAHWSDQEGIAASLIGGALAGVISWYVIMPFDMAKSLIQADFEGKRYKKLIPTMLSVYEVGGINALFRGAVINSIRAVPSNGVIFLVYSQSLKYLDERTKGTPAD